MEPTNLQTFNLLLIMFSFVAAWLSWSYMLYYAPLEVESWQRNYLIVNNMTFIFSLLLFVFLTSGHDKNYLSLALMALIIQKFILIASAHLAYLKRKYRIESDNPWYFEFIDQMANIMYIFALGAIFCFIFGDDLLW